MNKIGIRLEEEIEFKLDMTYQIIQRIEDIGAAKIILCKILDDDLFLNLSKHHPYWHSNDTLTSEKLCDTRIKLTYIQDGLHEVLLLLSRKEKSLE